MEACKGCWGKRRGSERKGGDKIDVVCEIILSKVIERECQESKSESFVEWWREN